MLQKTRSIWKVWEEGDLLITYIFISHKALSQLVTMVILFCSLWLLCPKTDHPTQEKKYDQWRNRRSDFRSTLAACFLFNVHCFTVSSIVFLQGKIDTTGISRFLRLLSILLSWFRNVKAPSRCKQPIARVALTVSYIWIIQGLLALKAFLLYFLNPIFALSFSNITFSFFDFYYSHSGME